MNRTLRSRNGRPFQLCAMRSEKSLVIFFLLFGFLLFADTSDPPLMEQKEEEIAFSFFKKETTPPKQDSPPDENGYTINYNTVSMIEYIRFASKICSTNFIFDDQDLNFTVTVVSKEPITPSNVMATLLQILRIHGLQIIEQDGSLVIHKNGDVKQLAKVVTEQGQETGTALVTRVFRLKNAKPESVSPIIKSMISGSAILETSAETRQLILTDTTGNVDKVATLIDSLDSPHTTLIVQSYTAQFNTPDYLVEIASQLINPIAQGNPFHLVPAHQANTVFIVSTPELVKRTMEILATLDLPQKKSVVGERKLKSENIFVYKLEHKTGGEILSGLNQIADNLEQSGIPDPDLIETLEASKWIRETNSIMLVGSKTSIDKVKEFVMALDVEAAGKSQHVSFFIYKPTSRSAKEIYSAIEEMANNLQADQGADPAVIAVMKGAKINSSTNTITFSGEERTFARIREILATIDAGKGPKAKNNFYVYKLNTASPTQFESSLKSFAKTLDKSQAADDGLIDTIEGMKYMGESHSFLFTGPETSLKRLQEIIPSFDAGAGLATSSQFLNYKPVHQKGPELLTSLKDLAENLKSGHLADPMMLKSLESAKWVPSTGTILITGDSTSLKKIQDLLATLDHPTTTKTGYYIYKLQSPNGEAIEDDLDTFAKNFQSSGLKDTKIVDVIDNMRYVKETNSILLTGDPTAINEVKELIAKYDFPRETAAKKSNFYMYKPHHMTATNIEKSLRDIGKSLSAAGLADPSLLSTINSAKYVETTNSLIFTGPPDTLSKVESLLKEVDVPPAKAAPIQHVGAKVFLLYKLKSASGPQITASLEAMTTDLKKSGTSDKDFLQALGTMKYVKETNSLLFTGQEEALKKVEALVERFDVSGYGGSSTTAPQITASNFFIYKPQSIAGPELEKLIQDFAENLKQSGLVDVDLFNAISSMRWVDKTQSLLFTGNPKALDQVKTLLKDFDISGNLSGSPQAGGPLEPSIQAIDNTSFLVYKLQFHKGDEIQGALRQIAKDLMLSNAPVNQNLLNAINSIQWLEVTNSLLCSGDQETLTRLRELIKSLDIPLKQVFIEILMIQTSLTNALTFGLEWGAQYQYRNKFAGQLNNLIPSASGGSDPLNTGLSSVTPTSPPVPTDVAILGPGFDLGVIGEVIRHGGDTYLSIGSLMAALQIDSETTIVMTPKILTQDGRTSTIFQGSNIPFAGSFISNNSATAGANATIGTTNLEYRDIGVNLTITPVLGNSDIVTLDIALDQTQTIAGSQNNQITFNQNGLPSNLNGITTSKVTMQTTVHVPDDHFLILSGIVNNSNAKTKTGIPCLGTLPLIGAAFSQDNTTVNNTSVVIFLRPHILTSLDDMTRVTRHEESFFRDQTGSPQLERNYNEAMELIKSVNDE